MIDEYELGRAITPYGTYMNPANGGYGTNGYDENWEHTFVYDITDYQHLLVDSVEIDAFYSGWSSGFSATLDFEFIEGTALGEVLRLRNVYKNGASSFSYSFFQRFRNKPNATCSIRHLGKCRRSVIKAHSKRTRSWW